MEGQVLQKIKDVVSLFNCTTVLRIGPEYLEMAIFILWTTIFTAVQTVSFL